MGIQQQTDVPRAFFESCLVDDPGDFVDLVSEARDRPAFYWEHPATGEAVAGIGSVFEIRCEGARRFEEASQRAMAVLNEIKRIDASGPGPVVVGGFGFSDWSPRVAEWREFPAARLFIPQELWVRRAGECWMIRVCYPSGSPWQSDEVQDQGRAAPDSLTNPAAERRGWEDRVEEALLMLREGVLRKVVLARSKDFGANSLIRPDLAARALRDTRPECFTYWFQGGSTHFIGSTPELLAQVDGREVRTVALAGSAPRDHDVDRDKANALRLLDCPKNRSEHDIVVEEVKEKLAGVCAELSCPDKPQLREFPEAYHLATSIDGVLDRPLTAVEVAGLLHPTSAVCGIPSTVAADLIVRGGEERGWYSGVVGWMGADGDGSFAVALRSGLLEGRKATLWAGAGIVEASDAAAEFEETETKMGAMADVLESR